MFKQNLTLLKYYNTTKKEWSVQKVIQVLDAMCMNHFPNPDSKFANEVIEFVEVFKKENKQYFTEHQDAIVFRMYADIIKNKVQEQSNSIHTQLTEQEKKYASDFVDKIFALNIELVAVVSANSRTHMQLIDSIETLLTIVEFLIYSKNAVLLFYGKTNKRPEPVTFGFTLKDGKFYEIDAKNLASMSKKTDTTFITFSEITH